MDDDDDDDDDDDEEEVFFLPFFYSWGVKSKSCVLLRNLFLPLTP